MSNKIIKSLKYKLSFKIRNKLADIVYAKESAYSTNWIPLRFKVYIQIEQNIYNQLNDTI